MAASQLSHRNRPESARWNDERPAISPTDFLGSIGLVGSLEGSGEEDNGLADWMGNRLDQLEKVLNEREWLAADRFTAADLDLARKHMTANFLPSLYTCVTLAYPPRHA